MKLVHRMNTLGGILGLALQVGRAGAEQIESPAAPEVPPAEPSGEPASAPGPLLAEPPPLEAELKRFITAGGLTSEMVADRTEQTSLRIEAKKRAAEGAALSAKQASQEFYPQLSLSARYTRLSQINQPAFGGSPGLSQVFVRGESATPTDVAAGEQLIKVTPPSFSFPVILDNFDLRATLNIPVSDYVLRLSHAVGAANEARYAAEWNQKAERLIVRAEAKTAYYGWVKAMGAVYIAEKSKTQVESAYQDVQRSFQIGTASKADVLRTEAQLRNAELMVTRATRAAQLGADNLRVLQHDSGSGVYSVGEDILAPFDAASLESLDGAVEEAQSKRLELRALEALERSYRGQAKLARAEMYPRLDVQANGIYANPNQRIIPATGNFDGTWDASAILSWTPTAIPKAQSARQVSEMKALEYAAQRAQLRDGIRMEILSAQTELENAKSAVATSRQVLGAAEEGYRVRRELFLVGRATTLEVTEAQNSLTAARLELFFAHADARIAHVKLLHALGRDVQP